MRKLLVDKYCYSKEYIMSEEKDIKNEEQKENEFLEDDLALSEEEEKALQEKIKKIRERDPFVYR